MEIFIDNLILSRILLEQPLIILFVISIFLCFKFEKKVSILQKGYFLFFKFLSQEKDNNFFFLQSLIIFLHCESLNSNLEFKKQGNSIIITKGDLIKINDHKILFRDFLQQF